MNEHFIFRACAYHQEMDISIIVDCHDIYENKSLVTTILEAGGFTQVRVTKILDIPITNIPDIPIYPGSLLLRAIARGKPIKRSETSFQVGNKYYWEEKQ